MKGVSEPTIKIVMISGKEYVLSLLDVTAVEAREFRSWTGMGPIEVLTSGEADLDRIAGLLTLARRKHGERRLSYQEVSSTLSFRDIDDVQFLPDGEESQPDPTRAGSSS